MALRPTDQIVPSTADEVALVIDVLKLLESGKSGKADFIATVLPIESTAIRVVDRYGHVGSERCIHRG